MGGGPPRTSCRLAPGDGSPRLVAGPARDDGDGDSLGPAQSLRPFVRLALLEGSRLEQDGDLAGAWRLSARRSGRVATSGCTAGRSSDSSAARC